jgi:small-conductance mechanosensitive channel/CRP-like cAMP-binding protein
MPSPLRRLIGPLATVALLIAPALLWEDFVGDVGGQVVQQTLVVLRYGVLIAVWLALAWLVVRLIDVVVWQGIVAGRLGGTVPRLLKDVAAAAVFLLAVTGIVGVVFELPVTGLWATTGAASLVIGLALQSMISDVFQGIAINVDRPYRIGDWVQIFYRGAPPMIGCVLEINWRSTRLKRTDNTLLVVPNHLMADIVIQNLSLPDPTSRFELTFCLDFAVPHERALRIITAGVRAAGTLEEPAPTARVNGANGMGVEYLVRYWLDPAKVSPAKGRNLVTCSVLSHLHSAGLTLAYHKQDTYIAEMPPRALSVSADREVILSRINLFETLDGEDIRGLGDQVDERVVAVGAEVVTRGQPGASMFVLVEGLLHVFVPGQDGNPLRVAQIVPGSYFGEMSLLTGAERSATITASTSAVVYEIGKAAFAALLERRPDLAEHISHTVALRQMRNQEAFQRASQEDQAREADSMAHKLLGKMRAFLGF